MTVEEVVSYVLKTPYNTNKAILTSMLEELEGSNTDGIVQLRRNNDYNYEAIADTFIPANGEICLVDTARDGLRAKCGDGKSTWRELDYIDEFIVKGYLNEGKFYRDLSFSQLISGATQKLYIDLTDRTLYYHDEELGFIGLSQKIQLANSEEPGLVKLYQNTGDKEDGTMTQKAISDELDDKVEIVLKAEEETLVFVQ